MNHLSPFTCRRINRLPRSTSIWEGDRRTLTPVAGSGLPTDIDVLSQGSDCILWVDGSRGIVRAVDMVPAETGNEAVVRTLIQAIENPQGNVEPARPRKIVVKDRQLQFFLRGALQNLDLEIEYVPALPLIDDIFETLMQSHGMPPTNLPEIYADPLLKVAATIWEDTPWYLLNEQEILAIDIHHWDIETLYVSVLGMADVEYGLLMYRSLESLRQFRESILTSDSSSHKELQEAFLSQDCLYVNFELETDEPSLSIEHLAIADAIHFEFGSIHPLEGLRTSLADEEAATLIVALEALHRFVKKYGCRLDGSTLPDLSGKFQIPNPVVAGLPKTLNVTVKTLPEVADELSQVGDVDGLDTSLLRQSPPIRDDFIPDRSLILLTELSVAAMATLRESPKVYHQEPLRSLRKFSKSTPWPVLIIQTTRPKATVLIEKFRAVGGIEALCFNPGSDPFNRRMYRLGLIKTADGSFHLFHEYAMEDPQHTEALTQWQAGQTQSQGRCGVIIASGVSGQTRGVPNNKDILAFFEAESLPPEALNLDPMVLRYAMDFE